MTNLRYRALLISEGTNSLFPEESNLLVALEQTQAYRIPGDTIIILISDGKLVSKMEYLTKANGNLIAAELAGSL